MSENNIGESRKKAILAQKKVPKPDKDILVWVTNKEGSGYIQLGSNQIFEGDELVRQFMLNKIIPQINKSIGKIWINQQQHTFKSLIFPKISVIIRTILIVLGISLAATLLTKSYLNMESQILIVTIVFLWLGCIVITAYTFTRKYEKNQFDQLIINEVKQILIESNAIYLKKRGYVTKCDQLALWISTSKDDNSISPKSSQDA